MVVTAYVALLRKQADSDFGVEFPDFPGCITVGFTLEDAHQMAAEVLLLYIEGLIRMVTSFLSRRSLIIS